MRLFSIWEKAFLNGDFLEDRALPSDCGSATHPVLGCDQEKVSHWPYKTNRDSKAKHGFTFWGTKLLYSYDSQEPILDVFPPYVYSMAHFLCKIFNCLKPQLFALMFFCGNTARFRRCLQTRVWLEYSVESTRWPLRGTRGARGCFLGQKAS